MADYAANGITKNSATEVRGSRINSDVERVIKLAYSINNARDNAIRHAAALGYFMNETSAEVGGKVQPISNNMQTALADLERAIDSLHGALNLFD